MFVLSVDCFDTGVLIMVSNSCGMRFKDAHMRQRVTEGRATVEEVPVLQRPDQSNAAALFISDFYEPGDKRRCRKQH